LPGTIPQVRLPHFRLRGPPKPCSLFAVNRPDRILFVRLAATLGQNIEGLFRLLRERFESNLFQLENLIHHPAPSLDLQEQETICFDLVESPVRFGDILDRGTVDRIDEISGLDIVARVAVTPMSLGATTTPLEVCGEEEAFQTHIAFSIPKN
jgi:hypothetical protein